MAIFVHANIFHSIVVTYHVNKVKINGNRIAYCRWPITQERHHGQWPVNISDMFTIKASNDVWMVLAFPKRMWIVEVCGRLRPLIK